MSKEVAIMSPLLLKWYLPEIGWGRLNFYLSKDGKLHCENETLDKETIKEILGVMVDECILDE